MQKLSYLLLLTSSFWIGVYAQTLPVVFEDWNSQEGTQNFFVRSVTATDASNNIYVAGATINAQGNYDILLAKYKSDGTFEWASQYAGQGAKDDAATAVAIRGSIIYVTGHVFNTPTNSTSLVLLKYDSNGNLIWDEIYNTNNAIADAGTSIFLQSVGLSTEIYVGGVSVDTLGNVDFLALKYNESGGLIWSKLYDHAGYIDLCHSIRVRTSLGNTTVTLAGASQVSATDWRYLSVSLNGINGNVTGSTSSTGGSAVFSKVTGVERDAAGDVYITGSVYNIMSGYDFYTVKINASNTNVVWDATYNSSGTLNDEAMALAVDSVGNVYVTGYSETSTQATNYTTIKYDSNGNQLWVKNYNASSNGADTAKAIVLHPNGSVIVSGASFNGSNTDVVTLKYDTAGTQKWEIAFNSVFNKNDTPFDMAIDNTGDIVIEGQSQNDTSYTYTTIKYKEIFVTLPVDSVSLASNYGFTPNKGQLLSTDSTLIPHIRYYTHIDHYSIYFSDTACSFVLAAIDTTMANDTLHRVDMKYKNYMDPKVRAMDITDYYSNFYYAHTAKGREKVHDYKQLYNANVWDKVDVLINSNAGGIKYNIIAHPGFKESNIEFEFEGQDSIYIDNNELIIQTSIGNIILPEPKAYEIDANDNLSLLNWTPQYVLNGNILSFSYGSYNTSKKLVIVIERALPADGGNEPGVCWSTYFGGNNWEEINGITIDNNSNQYITGTTSSNENFFPITPGSEIDVFSGFQQPFISSFGNDNRLKWSTYYGGTDHQNANDIVYKNTGHLYITGYTVSSDFLVVVQSGAYNQTSIGDNFWGDAFVLKFDTLGFVVWATYFGGSTREDGRSLCVDSNGNLYLVGNTTSATTFPIVTPTGSYSQSYGGNIDAFISKFDNNDSLVWSTYYGGNETDRALTIRADNNNNVVIQGFTGSSNFPTFNPGGGAFYDNTLGGSVDDWIAKFSTTGQCLWATLIGGSSDEQIIVGVSPSGNRIAFDAQNNIYMVGSTTSNNFPAPYFGSGYYNGSVGTRSGYILKFNTSNYQVMWATLISSQGQTNLNSIAVAQDGKVFVAGSTDDSLFPFLQQSTIYYQDELSGTGTPWGVVDGCILVFSSSHDLIYGSLYGGYQEYSYGEFISDIEIDNDKFYFVGYTTAEGISNQKQFPLSTPGGLTYYDPSYNGMRDAFVSMFCIDELSGIISNKIYNDNRFLLYPNPSSNEINLFFYIEEEQDAVLAVSDYLGKIVLNNNISLKKGHNNRILNIENLSNGVYILSLSTGEWNKNIKFVKQ